MTNIYALYDPRIPDLPFYVGKGLAKRAQYHWHAFQRKGTAVNAFLRRWFEQLRADGVEPTWQFLEENVSNWQDAEKEWIATARRINSQLCNVAAGGNQWPKEAVKLAGEMAREYVKQNLEKYQKFGRELGLKVHRMYPNLHSSTMKKTHKKYPNMSSEVAKKTHRDNPKLAKRMGKAGIIGLRKKYSLETRRQWSSIAGRKNAIKPGFLRRSRLIGLHNRWHRNRNVIKEGCEFCQGVKKCA